MCETRWYSYGARARRRCPSAPTLTEPRCEFLPLKRPRTLRPPSVKATCGLVKTSTARGADEGTNTAPNRNGSAHTYGCRSPKNGGPCPCSQTAPCGRECGSKIGT